jgi:predicted kinase
MIQGKPIIYILLGVPGSGKSHFARNLAKEISAIHFNSDAVRMAIFKSRQETNRIYHSEDRAILNTYIFGALNYAAEAALLSGCSVMYDACNNTRQERADVVRAMPKDSAPIVIWVQAPLELAVKRAIARSETKSDRKLSPEEASKYIEKVASEIETPSANEKLITIDGTIPFKKQYESFQKQLKEIQGE